MLETTKSEQAKPEPPKSGSANHSGADLTPHYSLIQSFFWMQFAVVMGFSSMYLLGHGFTNGQIGAVIAVGGTVSAILQPVIAGYADRPSSPSLKKVIAAIAACLPAMGLLMLFFGRIPVAAGLLYGGCIAFLQFLTPLVNALGTECINQGKRLNFGIARGLGSVAYAVIAYLLGILVDKKGTGAIPVSIVVVFVCFLAALARFPFSKIPRTPGRPGSSGHQNPLAFFARYRRFSFVLFGCVLVYISHVLLNSFTYQIVESKGGGSAETGFVMALCAVVELPTMFFFGFLVKKVRCDLWFRISGIFFALKTLGTLLAPSIPVFYAVQFFQMFGFALLTVSSVYYVNSIMDAQDAIKGQAYMTMTNTLGSVLGALIGGQLIDRFGVNTTLAFGTAVSVLGALIMLFGTEATGRR